MGTDIHLYVEKRNTDGTWSAVKLPFRGWKGGEKYHDGYEGWSDRSYDTFSILADIRNGHGFAGVVTGDGFNVISEPRGLPDDVSDTLNPEKNTNEDGERVDGTPWLGDHSFSWLTYDDIVGFDWTQTTNRQGVVSASEYAKFKKAGQPSSWSGGVWGRDVQHLANEEMDALIASLSEVPDDFAPGAYTSVRWPITYTDAAKNFLAWLNEIVKPIADEVGSDNVRLVFGFDS